MDQKPPVLPFVALEKSLLHLADLLCCASATADRSSQKRGPARLDLTCSSLHLMDMARVELQRSLQCLKVCAHTAQGEGKPPPAG